MMGFLNFLGINNQTTNKKSQVKTQNSDIQEDMQTFIIEMQSPYFDEQITTKIIKEKDKTIEIKKIKSTEPLNNGKTLVTTKIYKKEITRR